MKKTLYVRDEDEPIWERARELFGETLSPLIAQQLKLSIQAKEARDAQGKGFQRIVIEYSDSANNHMPTKKAFVGWWIFPPDAPLEGYDRNLSPEGPEYAVATT